jgi:hypothetical protein
MNRYPFASIALILIACIRFEYNAANWRFFSPGLAGGLAVLAIVGIVVVFQIFNAAQEICLSKGLTQSRLRFKYDVLIPIAILAVVIKANWQGGDIQVMGDKQVPQWVFAWSDPHLDGAFILAVIGLALLLRILTLLRAIVRPSALAS